MGWILVGFVGMVGGDGIVDVVYCVYFGYDGNVVGFEIEWIVVVVDFFVMM